MTHPKLFLSESLPKSEDVDFFFFEIDFVIEDSEIQKQKVESWIDRYDIRRNIKTSTLCGRTTYYLSGGCLHEDAQFFEVMIHELYLDFDENIWINSYVVNCRKKCLHEDKSIPPHCTKFSLFPI